MGYVQFEKALLQTTRNVSSQRLPIGQLFLTPASCLQSRTGAPFARQAASALATASQSSRHFHDVFFPIRLTS
jgi:hypothetical protein